MDLTSLHLKNVLIPPNSLTNFEMKKYYQNEPRYSGVYSRDNLPDKIKDGVYVINLDEYSDIGTHWTVLYVNIKTITYFDSFGVEHMAKEFKSFFKRSTNKFTIVTNIFIIQAYNSVMCGYFSFRSIDFMLRSNNFTNLFSPNSFKKMLI